MTTPSDTPRTDAAPRIAYEVRELSDGSIYSEELEYIEPDFARELERELISAQIDAGIWKERAEHAEQNCGKAIEIALEKTRAELTRALRVVEAVRACAVIEYPQELLKALKEWEAGR